MNRHSKNLARSGKPFEAYTMMTQVNHLLKESFSKDLNTKISEVEVKYKTEKIQREKVKAEENARQQKQIFLFSFLALIIIGGSVVYAFHQKKSARQKAIAHKQKLEALIEGEEKERNRIARDLHDGIVQDLTAIKLKMDSVPDKTREVNELVSEIDRATKEVRDIAYQMMPVALREYGLIPALEGLLEKSLTPNKIKFEFETVNIEERLPEKIEVCLYRITQELINNVVKHSKASSISLVVSKFHDNVSLVFEDNGKGFRENEIQKGIGMNSLSSRLEMVNGNLKFESIEGTGTMAIIKIPL
jgi:signal transduction histidine kinase